MYKYTKKKLIIISFIVAIMGAFLFLASKNNRLNTSTYSLSASIPVSAWSWQPLTPQDLEYASREGIDTIYLSIDEYLDIFELADNKVKQEKLKSFEQSLTNSLRSAKEKGIQIHALVGNSAWASSDYWYLPIEALRFVIRYNKAHPEAAFSGIQYDIEFYNNEEYKTSKDSLSLEYLKLLTQLVVLAQADQTQNLSLGVSMPYWFDNENGNAPVLAWESQTVPLAFHIMNILNMVPNSYITLMAYRNQAQGEGGTIQTAKAEFEYSASVPNVSLIIGQETEENEVDRITFYNKGKSALLNAMGQIIRAFSSWPTFGGIALHTLQGVRELK